MLLNRNSKAKTTKAVKALNGSHRVILSGTPIQNTVVELWSLFDFLMPGTHLDLITMMTPCPYHISLKILFIFRVLGN